MNKRFFPSIYLFAFLTLFMIIEQANAQCNLLTNAVAGPTLLTVSGTANRSSVAYNPNFDLYYSVNAGSGSYPIETYSDTGGNSVASVAAGISYRGCWWNPTTSQLEGNGHGTTGIRKQDLDASGYALGTGTAIFTGQNQPNTQSCGDLDWQAYEILYYDNGSIYRYARSTNASLGNYALNNNPSNLADITDYAVGYTGCAGHEIAIYDYVNRRVLLFDKANGNYAATVQLPGTAPQPPSFGFAFANDMAWVFDGTARIWYSYEIFQACTPPAANATALDTTAFCAGDSVVLAADTGANYSYQWQLNGADISGATGENLAVSASGSYTVVVSTGANCVDTSSAISVTVNALPTASISAAGTDICAGSSMMISAQTGAGYAYQWYKDGNIIAGATDSTFNADSSGSYTVEVTSSAGCMAVSNGVTINVLPLPAASISAGGPTAFCEGDSVTLTATGGGTYQWYESGNPVAGATNATITVAASGSYTVEATDSNGCAGTSAATTVTVFPNPVPVITAAGGVLSTGTMYSSYQWLLNGNSIPGATTNSYTPAASGTYSVTVMDMNGCSGTSDTTFVTVGLANETFPGSLSIYPNPAAENFVLALDGAVSGPVFVRVLNLVGETVFEANREKQGTKFSLRIESDHWAPGMYFVQAELAGRRKVLRVIRN